jgi:hypothetical protein
VVRVNVRRIAVRSHGRHVISDVQMQKDLSGSAVQLSLSRVSHGLHLSHSRLPVEDEVAVQVACDIKPACIKGFMRKSGISCTNCSPTKSNLRK